MSLSLSLFVLLLFAYVVTGVVAVVVGVAAPVIVDGVAVVVIAVSWNKNVVFIMTTSISIAETPQDKLPRPREKAR